MKKTTTILISALLSLVYYVKADEGMWLPILINQNMTTMTEMGIQLTADDIFNINESSIKDAIVALDHGSCTGELISGQGLVLTNHHCGYAEIQAHSSVEHDYLTNGFWAKSFKEELANPGKTMSFLINASNVTERIVSAIPKESDQATRNYIVDSVSTVIINEATKDNNYEAGVESMFKGNNYYLFLYETFRDIRLVGAPPESIGKFGSDTDNWMWPRHTCDFSMFRIYADAEGKPADYSEDNVPLKPKHFLPISLNGYKTDDFAFIMGYPGSTSRYMTSYELKYTMDYENVNRAKIRGTKQAIWKKEMDKSDKVRIQYATKFARSSNYWKYSIEQNKALRKNDVYGQKVKLEQEFAEWVNANDKRKEKYGNALQLIKEAVEATNEINSAQQYIMETQFYYYGEAYRFAYSIGNLTALLQENPDSTATIKYEVEQIKKSAKNFFKDYNIEVDKKTSPALLKMFIDDVNSNYYPDYIANILNKKYKGDVDKYFNNFFKKSIFVDEAKFNEFLSNPSYKTLSKDPVFIAVQSTLNTLRSFSQISYPAYLKMQEGMRLFVAGLMEMNPDKIYAPDANSTMRLTYGSVGDYNPADAVHYDYYTTLKGVMEKEDPDVREFNVPAKLKEIYKNKDFGPYGNPDGTMNVCFTTNNDITGGNSGSPVINARGELLGAAFDGNSEAMSGDIAFEKSMQKCINVDIRYVLLIIDKYAGAQNLIDEMKLVKTEAKPEKVKEETTEPVLEETM